MDRAAEELGITKWEDWYHISMEKLLKVGIASLITGPYGGSLSRALQTIYPGSKKYFSSAHIVRTSMENVAVQCGAQRVLG
jgi:hypothetical protein